MSNLVEVEIRVRVLLDLPEDQDIVTVQEHDYDWEDALVNDLMERGPYGEFTRHIKTIRADFYDATADPDRMELT